MPGADAAMQDAAPLAARPSRRTRNARPAGRPPAARRILKLASLLFVLCLLAPGAQAQIVHFEKLEVLLRPERFDATFRNNVVEGSNASALRTQIDRDHGDGDQIVLPTEVAAYVAATLDDYNEQLENFGSFLTRGILVNERPPTSVAITNILLEGAPGSTASVEPITRDFEAEMVFTSSAKARNNVTFEQDFRKTLPSTSFKVAFFTAAEGYRIDGESIVPDGPDNAFWLDGGFVVAYDQMDAFSDVETPLDFQLVDPSLEQVTKPEKKKDSPGLGSGMMIPALLSLVGVLALARRKDSR